MVTSEEDRDIMFEEEDIPYEEEILRNPCAVKCWQRYIEHKKNAPNNVINMVSAGIPRFSVPFQRIEIRALNSFI